MDLVIACLAKILRLKFYQCHYLSKSWDGSAQGLRVSLQRLEVPHKDCSEILFEAEKTIRDCHKNKIHILWPGHPDYPQGFHHIHKAPFFLSYVGDSELIHQPKLSVVGAREPLVWVEDWLEQELKRVLQEKRVVTVSGGARGIDQMVHQLSMRLERPSIAVLPSGLLNQYPQSFKRFKPYIERGYLGVLSEYLPWEPMRKHHFHSRNRLISAMSPLLFVVQSQQKSGTMITACHAIDQGKTICTLSSSPVDVKMSGNLQLLFDGAQMIRWGSDLQSLIPTQSH